jgi:hypothetical protein
VLLVVDHPWVAAFNHPEGGFVVEIFLPVAGDFDKKIASLQK